MTRAEQMTQGIAYTRQLEEPKHWKVKHERVNHFLNEQHFFFFQTSISLFGRVFFLSLKSRAKEKRSLGGPTCNWRQKERKEERKERGGGEGVLGAPHATVRTYNGGREGGPAWKKGKEGEEEEEVEEGTLLLLPPPSLHVCSVGIQYTQVEKRGGGKRRRKEERRKTPVGNRGDFLFPPSIFPSSSSSLLPDRYGGKVIKGYFFPPPLSQKRSHIGEGVLKTFTLD